MSDVTDPIFRVAELEKAIQDLESRQKQLTEELQSPDTHAAPGRSFEISRELKSIGMDLMERSVEWEESATRLSTLDTE